MSHDKTEKLICSGFGGQGVLTLGQIVAILGMKQDKKVTWMPSYGAEMRGGTSNCTVIVSDALIASPIVEKGFTCLIAMNNPSVDKFAGRVADDGTVIINSSMVTREMDLKCRVVSVDATALSAKVGNPKGQNMVMLGAYVGASGRYTLEEVQAVFEEKFKGKKASLIGANMECVKLGMEAAQK